VNAALQQAHLIRAAAFQQKHRAGLMTLLFTDMVGSTKLKMELGDVAATEILCRHHALVRAILSQHPDAEEISTAGDSFFIVFKNPSDAVAFALQLQAALRVFSREVQRTVQDRIGIHVGEVLVEEHQDSRHPKELSGIQVDTCARVMGLCPGGRILLTRFAFDNARQMLRGQNIEGVGALQWLSHGFFELKGVDEEIEICEVAERGAIDVVPIPESEKARPTGGGLEAVTPVVVQDSGRVTWAFPSTLRRVRSNLLYGTIGGALVVAATLVTLALPVGNILRDFSYDASFWFRPIVVPDGVVLVYMDDKSHIELGQPWFRSWDRSIHARLVERLAGSGAKAIVFDVLFEESRDLTNSAGGDRQLILACQKHGKVFVAGTIAPHVHEGIVIGSRLVPPFPDLRAVTKWGLVERAQADYSIRRHYLPPPQHGLATLAECVAAEIGGRQLPLRDRVRWINYYGPPGTLPYHSYCEAISEEVLPASTFSNKVVFIGAQYGVGFTGGKGTDDYVTPYTRLTGRKSPGAEVLATTYLNLVRGDWLRQVSPLLEFSVLVILGFASGFLLALCRPVWSAGLGLAGGTTLGIFSILMVWQTHHWFSWAITTLVQVPVAVTWSILAETLRMRKEKGLILRALETRHAQLKKPGCDGPLGSKASAAPFCGDLVPSVPDHRLIRPIGRGAYGQVWLAEDVTGAYHAVKVVYLRSFKDRKPFEREFKGVQRFTPLSRSHPGFIHILHVGLNEKEKYFYYIMEAADDLVAGTHIEPERYVPKSLANVLAESGPLAFDACVTLALNLSDALQFLHENGLIHRDIKPSNILFVRDKPKLADIGLVEDLVNGQAQISAVGTLGYLAPEGPGHPQADIFSLGKVIYEASMGKQVDDFPALPTDLAQREDSHRLLQLNEVILKACNLDPAKRYQSAHELYADLLKLQNRDTASSV